MAPVGCGLSLSVEAAEDRSSVVSSPSRRKMIGSWPAMFTEPSAERYSPCPSVAVIVAMSVSELGARRSKMPPPLSARVFDPAPPSRLAPPLRSFWAATKVSSPALPTMVLA